MNKKEKNNKELTIDETLQITQELVQEFIQTKQNIMVEDRKINVIGRALIEQGVSLEKIHSIQSSHGEELSRGLGDVVDRQDEVFKEIINISESIEGLQDARQDQERLVQELDYFKRKHEELVDSTNEKSENSVKRLTNVSEEISKLFEYVEGVDIEDKVLDISNRTAEVNELLKLHADAQEQSREEASKGMLELLAGVTSFKRQLSEEGLTGQLTKIQKVSDGNKHMIDEINEKFDMFVEIYELSKVEAKSNLDDLFVDDVDSLESTFLDEIELEEQIEHHDDSTPQDSYELTQVDKVEQLDDQIEEDVGVDDIKESDETVDEDLSFNDESNYIDSLTEEFIVDSTINSSDDNTEDVVTGETIAEEFTADAVIEEAVAADFAKEETIVTDNIDDDLLSDEVEDKDLTLEEEDTNGSLADIGDSADGIFKDDLIEIPEYGRIDRVDESTKTQEEEKKKGFFGKLFGGR